MADRNEERPRFSVPRDDWGLGPWEHEPDKVEWRHAPSGYPCLMVRNYHGAWCGYVGLPPGHPYHGEPARTVEAEAHGGINYASGCVGAVCHEPSPGEPDDVWWVGFDCCHVLCDYAPAMVAEMRAFTGTKLFDHGHYWTVPEVKDEVEELAAELYARRNVAKPPRGEVED